MSDINELLAAEEASQTDHIYLVSFEVLTKVDAMEADTWVNDELSVATGPDGEAAIAKVKEHVAKIEEYSMTVKQFRLIGLKLLAVADL